MACNLKSVLSNATCSENPAGISNFCWAIPLENIGTITANDDKNSYEITASGGGETALKGYRIDFKSQTGQVTTEDNGMGKGWSATGTGRVELNEDGMAWTSRGLHNSDKYIYLFPTGKSVDGKKEFHVVGNENGEAEWSVTADTGSARGDDHGQTFTVTCGYQLYPLTKFYGNVEQEDAA